jgi:hypothetical protein
LRSRFPTSLLPFNIARPAPGHSLAPGGAQNESLSPQPLFGLLYNRILTFLNQLEIPEERYVRAVFNLEPAADRDMRVFAEDDIGPFFDDDRRALTGLLPAGDPVQAVAVGAPEVRLAVPGERSGAALGALEFFRFRSALVDLFHVILTRI